MSYNNSSYYYPGTNAGYYGPEQYDYPYQQRSSGSSGGRPLTSRFPFNIPSKLMHKARGGAADRRGSDDEGDRWRNDEYYNNSSNYGDRWGNGGDRWGNDQRSYYDRSNDQRSYYDTSKDSRYYQDRDDSRRAREDYYVPDAYSSWGRYANNYGGNSSNWVSSRDSDYYYPRGRNWNGPEWVNSYDREYQRPYTSSASTMTSSSSSSAYDHHNQPHHFARDSNWVPESHWNLSKTPSISVPWDVVEDSSKGMYFVYCELPGVRKEDIHLDIENDRLVLYGSKSCSSSAECDSSSSSKIERQVYKKERHFGPFHRVLPIPKIDASQVAATFENGILQISFPKPAGLGAFDFNKKLDFHQQYYGSSAAPTSSSSSSSTMAAAPTSGKIISSTTTTTEPSKFDVDTRRNQYPEQAFQGKAPQAPTTTAVSSDSSKSIKL